MAIRKLELHLDSAAAIILVFATSFGFNLYQRYQYRSLVQASVSNQMEAASLRSDVEIARLALGRCEKKAR